MAFAKRRARQAIQFNDIRERAVHGIVDWWHVNCSTQARRPVECAGVINRKGLSYERMPSRNLSGYVQVINHKEEIMPANIFYIIGVIVVVLFILGYLGLR